MINTAGHTYRKYYNIAMDGIDDYVDLIGSDATTSGNDVAFTIVASLERGVLTAGDFIYNSFVATPPVIPDPNNRQMILRLNAFRVELLIRNGGSNELWQSNSTISTMQNYVITVVVDAATNQCDLYIDGILDGWLLSGTVPNPIIQQTKITPRIASGGDSTGLPVGNLSCQMKYFAIYDRVLSVAEITNLKAGYALSNANLKHHFDATDLYWNGSNYVMTDQNSGNLLTVSNGIKANRSEA
jgi:hypothetical protein